MQTHPLGPLHPLAAFRQFIPVRLVPLAGGKVDKLPIDYRTDEVTLKGSGGAHNPEVWLTYEAAALCAEGYALATGQRHGVGFVLTADDPFICVDIDGCLQPDGISWSPLALEIVRSMHGAVVEVSQSGRGLHIWCRSITPIDHGKKNVALGLECYSSLRFILLGSGANGAMTEDCPGIRDVVARYFPPRECVSVDLPDDGPRADWNGPEDDEELLRRATQSKSVANRFGGDTASFADLWHADADALARAYSGDESAADAALCAHLAFWTGCHRERIDRLMRRSKLAREKYDREDYLPRTIAFVCSQQRDVLRDKRPEPGPSAVSATHAAPGMTAVEGSTFLNAQQQAELFKGCIYIADAHRVLVPGGYLRKPDQFNAIFGGYTFAMDARNERTCKKAFEAFTESQVLRGPKADGTCFRPNLPYGYLVRDAGRVRANTWWPVEVPRKNGDPSRFLNHLAKLLPDERDRMICLYYMAACVQYQGIKFQWAPVIQGVEGNGKTLLSRCVAESIGARYVHWPKASKLTNQFNGWMVGKTFFAVEDIHTSENKDVIEELKPMITGGDGLEIEGKGIDQISTEICGNFMFNTNHPNGIRKTKNDRRFCWVATAQQAFEDLARDGMDGDYMRAIYRWLKEEDGYAIVAEFLWSLPIPDEFNPATGCQRAPSTTSTNAAIEAGLGRVEQEILAAVESGEQGFAGGWISSLAVDRLLDRMGKAGAVPRNRRGELLRELGYVPHPALATNNGQMHHASPVDGARKPKLYVRTDHPARQITKPADVARAYSAAQEVR